MNNFEKHIENYFDSRRQCMITDAMRYSMEGGKRFRPQIIFAIVKGFGLDEEIAYDAALALELIQTYSLIHDDLPAMDNDDLRRGKPTCHKAFREDIAILAGDELLTESFGVIADSNYSPEAKISMISDLSKYAGLGGMVYGQLLDVTATKCLTEDDLREIQDNKTGGLFKISCLMAMNIAGYKDVPYFTELGSRIGYIFQNQDDLFDIIKSESETGKTASDIVNDKLTALSFKSVEELKEEISNEFSELDSFLDKAPFDHSYLDAVLNQMRRR